MPATTAASTPLAGLHEQHGARMTEFAGWSLPLRYAGAGIVAEHVRTRAGASLFDVSHMCQMRLAGQDAPAMLERILPVAMGKVRPGRSKYTFACDENGGMLDDLIVGNDGDSCFLVCNAARAQVIQRHLVAHATGDAVLDVLGDRALVALQGPDAESVLQELLPACTGLFFMDSVWDDVAGARCRVSRSGYTGEDGFEISVPAQQAAGLVERLIADGRCGLAGLGARDTLRIEAGLCLYGQDVDTGCTPVEASLGWAIPPSARAAGRFVGAERILQQLEQGAPRSLAGLDVSGRAPVRSGARLLRNGQPAGRVTSGTYSPTLKRPVALAMVDSVCATPGCELLAQQRGAEIACTVRPLPFVQHRYKTKKRAAR